MSERVPFSRLSHDVVVDNPWHRYCRDHYVQADGSDGVYWYVEMTGSCASIPVFDDGSTVLVRVHRYLLGTDLWEFPIGGMRPGDDPLHVARAELHEEAGLLASAWTELGRFAPYKGVSTEVCHVFLARGLTTVPQRLEASERITAHRLPFAAARARLLEQPLADGQSLAALMLLDRWLAAGNTP
jgi:8-oxo-dGTP pyrophosphatase MutT (NUDIX family)